MFAIERLAKLQAAAERADSDFHAAIVRHFGERGAGDARYLPASHLPADVIPFRNAKIAADGEYFDAVRANRRAQRIAAGLPGIPL